MPVQKRRGKDVAVVRKKGEMKPKEKKICFTSSCGGHMEQLMMLSPLMKEFDSFIVTEKTKYEMDIQGLRVYKVPQTNRREILFPAKFVANIVKSFAILLKEKPDIVVSTGALATVPICIVAKKLGKKLIYIESFARVTSPNVTGKILYRYADQFYVQWESMLDVFPKAQCLGAIY
ncbi:MAG: PssD/Cps14F family polysaccharide biosynthesis glycosyltransferase [bacterium]